MDIQIGFMLALIAGCMSGSFSLPMKKTDKWAWENTWLVWAFTALLIVPWLVSFYTTGSLLSIYANTSPKILILVFIFGVGWGLGAVTFGQSIDILGMSLAFSICIGITIAMGSILPMLKDVSVFSSLSGIVLIFGIIIMLAGVVICAIAGRAKEISLSNVNEVKKTTDIRASIFFKGLILAILGGVFSSMINLAFAFGEEIEQVAQSLDVSPVGAADALWTFTFLGGLAVNIVYCSILLIRNKTFPNYKRQGTLNHWPLAVLMGVIWGLSIFVYGRAAILMGSMGKSAGWAIYMGCCILISNLWGILTGEWSQSKGKPLRIMLSGLIVVLGAILLIGFSNSLQK